MKRAKKFTDLYKVNYVFCIGWTPAEYRKFYKRNFDEDVDVSTYDGLTSFLDMPSGKRIVVVWTLNRKLSNIAHECVHAANWVLDSAGVLADHNNDEALAYLVGYLCAKALGEK